MKKVLKLEELWRTVEIVCFRIVEQSHRGQEFGDNSRIFTASNGFDLVSDWYPALDREIFFVRGSCEKGDNLGKCCSFHNRRKITEAVAEYNAFDFPDEDVEEEADVEKIVREVEIEGFKVTMIFEKKKRGEEDEV